jgi:hypothetical protein
VLALVLAGPAGAALVPDRHAASKASKATIPIITRNVTSKMCLGARPEGNFFGDPRRQKA